MSNEYNTNNLVILYKDVLNGFISDNNLIEIKSIRNKPNTNLNSNINDKTCNNNYDTISKNSEVNDIIKKNIELIIDESNKTDEKSEQNDTFNIFDEEINKNPENSQSKIVNEIEINNDLSIISDCVKSNKITIQFDENDMIEDKNNQLEFEIESENELKFNEITDEEKVEEEQESDPWEDAINDDKFYINNRIARIFPTLKNYNNYGKIKIDDDSFSYITVREIAEYISKIVCYHLLKYNVNPQKATLIDYTAGVGGNVLSFCRCFNKVIGIELIKERCEYLLNNISVYGFKNISVINESSIDYNEESLLTVNPNVVFVDPPWGGNDYKNSETLRLKLGETSVEDLVINIINKFSSYYKIKIDETIDDESKAKLINNNYNNKLIVLKLPKNYDIEYFYESIKKHSFGNYIVIPYLYILNKMLIIIIELSYY